MSGKDGEQAGLGDVVAEWEVRLADGVHRVQLEHGTTSGKRVVVVDGKEVRGVEEWGRALAYIFRRYILCMGRVAIRRELVRLQVFRKNWMFHLVGVQHFHISTKPAEVVIMTKGVWRWQAEGRERGGGEGEELLKGWW